MLAAWVVLAHIGGFRVTQPAAFALGVASARHAITQDRPYRGRVVVRRQREVRISEHIRYAAD